MKKKLLVAVWYYLPAAAWVGLIFSVSTGSFSADATGGVMERLLRAAWPGFLARLNETELWLLNVAARKAAHLTEYAVLAFLAWRAGARGRSERARAALRGALAFAIGCAVLDEAHQSLYANRTSAAADVLLDICGAALSVAAIRRRERRHAKCPTSVSLS